MATYKAFFNQKTLEIKSESLYGAKMQAVELFKATKKNHHMVSVVLCEVEGKTITHNGAELS